MRTKIIHKILREPLVHFLLIGAGLFLLFGLTRTPGGNSPKRILVDAGQVEQLTAQFKRTWMRSPTRAEMEGLIDNHVRDEVYFREALAMGLDQNDPLIRRRMRQKLEFILEDLSAASEPGEQELQRFLKQHADRFRMEPQVSFRQVYLNPEKHESLEKSAAKILKNLNAGVKPETLGDSTLMARDFDLTPQSVIARLFGESFAENIIVLAPGVWTGPLYSGIGVHLVWVTEHRKARMPDLTEVRVQVEREYLSRRRRELNDKAYAKLRENYEVIIHPWGAQGKAGEAIAATRPAGGDQ